jgi:hypothetical protein
MLKRDAANLAGRLRQLSPAQRLAVVSNLPPNVAQALAAVLRRGGVVVGPPPVRDPSTGAVIPTGQPAAPSNAPAMPVATPSTDGGYGGPVEPVDDGGLDWGESDDDDDAAQALDAAIAEHESDQTLMNSEDDGIGGAYRNPTRRARGRR